MRLLFVVPNWRWCEEEKNVNYPYPPYNLCLLAAIVREQCEKVEIVDAYSDDLTTDQLRTLIEERNPDVVGTTVLMDQLADAGHEVVRIVKDVRSTIYTLMGGVYTTLNYARAIEDPNLDYACIGEGEYVLPELLRYLDRKTDKLPGKGIAYTENGKKIIKDRADFVTDLDSLPIPAWDLIDFHAYSKFVAREFSPDSPRKLPYVRLYTSRGCPFTCSFCQVPAIAGNNVRRQGASKVIKELRHLKEEFGIKSFMNSDDNFFANRGPAKELLKALIDSDLNLPWICEDVGIMHLNEEMLNLSRASGCEYMGFAVETGVERISKEIIQGKPLRKEHTKKMLAIARDLGIFVSTNFIIGFPTETWDEIRETIQFAEELESDYTRVHILVPLKGTEIWEISAKEGYFGDLYDHFNGQAVWKTGQLESSREYSGKDLTILKAMEWDRINFTNAKRRRKIAKWLGVTEEQLLERRRWTIESMFRNIDSEIAKDEVNDRAFGCPGNLAARFERVDGSFPSDRSATVN